MDCHPNKAVIYPPNVGAIIGDTASTSISKEKIFAFSSTGKISLTRAREATNPAQEPKACKNLMPINIFAVGAKAQAIDVRK